MAPKFQQALPPGRTWTLVDGDKRSGTLLYRDASGAEIRVPSIWYNQPVAWRAAAMRFYAEQTDRAADYWRKGGSDPRRAAEMDARAVKYRDLAGRMETTGEILA